MEEILEIIAKFRKTDDEGYGYDAAVDAIDAIEKICLTTTDASHKTKFT